MREKVPCVQWHGQDWQGNITKEQFLFPICGKQSKLIECVREDFWRVRFLGSLSEWNKRYPDRPYAVVSNGKVQVETEQRSIIHIVANELWRHDDFSLVCSVVRRVDEDSRLLAPCTYENHDVHDELPLYECDKEIQKEWRLAYVENPSAIGEGTHRLNFLLSDGYHSMRTAPLYFAYLREHWRYIRNMQEN